MAREVLKLEGVKLIFRNFSGKPSEYNREGDRNFSALIDPADADKLKDDGWNIRQRENKDGDLYFFLPVKVSYKNIPPKAYMVTGRNKVMLDEESVGELDYADIQEADLMLSPYDWNVQGKSGRSAYLKTGYFVVEQDAFADKYDFEADPEDPDIPF